MSAQDFLSLPQHERSGEEARLFGEARLVMGNFYASITGTCVLQDRGTPSGEHYMGMVVLFNIADTLRSEEALRSNLCRFGEITSCTLLYSKRDCALVSFASASMADMAIDGLAKEQRAAAHYCNTTPYDHRGWVSKHSVLKHNLHVP